MRLVFVLFITIMCGFASQSVVAQSNCIFLPTRIMDTFFCVGNGVIINGKTYTKAGSYQDTIKRALPLCDSVLLITVRTESASSETRNVTICSGDTLKFNDKIITAAGAYLDTLPATNVNCAIYLTLNVRSIDLAVNFGDDITIERGDSVKLTPSVTLPPNAVITWRPSGAVSCKSCLSPIVSPKSTTTYELEVRDSVNGCVRYDQVVVNVKTCVGVYIPNSFSPNDDGNNDYFTVFAASCIQKVRVLSVYNRWGTLVFSKSNFEPSVEKLGWDGTFKGKTVLPDTYAFYIELEQKDGSIERYKGDVMLIR